MGEDSGFSERFGDIDADLEQLRQGASVWVTKSPEDVVLLLEAMLPKIAQQAPQMVDAANWAKGTMPDTTWGAEEWFTGPWAMAQAVNAYLMTFRRLAQGKSPLTDELVRGRSDGRVVVDAFPCTTQEKALFHGFSAEVWMPVGMTAEQVKDRAARTWRGDSVKPGVSLVLGAGNIASITFLDVMYQLLNDRHCVAVKMNPVNDYLGTYLQEIFADFISENFVGFFFGDAEIGQYLVHNELVDQAHITGSAVTHDLIVWGQEFEQLDRKKRNDPVLNKPITSELGGVSPFVVVPGEWTAADLEYQAEHLLTSKLNNAGHNCIATQVVLLSESWSQKDAFLEAIRQVSKDLPDREPYYPKAKERLFKVAARPDAQPIGSGLCHLVDLGLEGSANLEDEILTVEMFTNVMAVVTLRASSAAEFMPRATEFSNERLPGTLGVTVVIDPATEKQLRLEFATMLSNLRYGTVGVNIWSAMSFLLAYTPWGAFPEHSLQDVGSGIGVVHNSFLLSDPEKVIVRGPFRNFPRSVLSGEAALAPKLPLFVRHKHGALAGEALVAQATDPSATHLAKVALAALRS